MIQIIFAILAGVLTVASPCILPVLPVLLGISFSKSKARPLFIVFGFVVAFSLAAAFLSVLVKSIGLNPNVIRNAGIIVLGIFGLLLLWQKPFELLMLRLNPVISKIGIKAGTGNEGKFSAFILGAALGVVWAPCAGPVLASILTVIALQQDLLASFILLLAYSCGVGFPMLVIAYGGKYVAERIGAVSKYAEIAQKIFGIIIILLVVAMYFNYDVKIYAIILEKFPIFNPKF